MFAAVLFPRGSKRDRMICQSAAFRNEQGVMHVVGWAPGDRRVFAMCGSKGFVAPYAIGCFRHEGATTPPQIADVPKGVSLSALVTQFESARKPLAELWSKYSKLVLDELLDADVIDVLPNVGVCARCAEWQGRPDETNWSRWTIGYKEASDFKSLVDVLLFHGSIAKYGGSPIGWSVSLSGAMKVLYVLEPGEEKICSSREFPRTLQSVDHSQIG